VPLPRDVGAHRGRLHLRARLDECVALGDDAAAQEGAHQGDLLGGGLLGVVDQRGGPRAVRVGVADLV
jgi:hypothetical protein